MICIMTPKSDTYYVSHVLTIECLTIQKSSDRTFRITLKPTTSNGEGPVLTFRAVLPATYPKTAPKLSLSFSEDVRAATRAEAERLLLTKPRTLLGAEMIFEITTSLQDILDQALQRRNDNVPTLDEERASQQALITKHAEELEEEKRKVKAQASIEEEQYLQEMVESQKTRRTRLHAETSQDLEARPSKLVYGFYLTVYYPY